MLVGHLSGVLSSSLLESLESLDHVVLFCGKSEEADGRMFVILEQLVRLVYQHLQPDQRHPQAVALSILEFGQVKACNDDRRNHSYKLIKYTISKLYVTQCLVQSWKREWWLLQQISIDEEQIFFSWIVFFLLPSPDIINHVAFILLATGVLSILLVQDTSGGILIKAVLFLKNLTLFILCVPDQRALVLIFLLIDDLPHGFKRS